MADADLRSRRAAAKGLLALLVAILAATAPVRAEDVTPLVSPVPIEDVPSTRPDPFPAFDNFAWRAFVALNWPALADKRGVPDPSKRLSDPGPRVWETFKARYETFPPSGAPSDWDSISGMNPCGVDNRQRTVAAFPPFAEFNQASFTPGSFDPPVVAANRTYLRYEVRVNREEYQSIVDAGLYDPERAPTLERPLRVATGSVSVKAAWRLLDDADPPEMRARYYVARGVAVTDVAASRAAGKVVCETRDLALIGLHIVVRTKYRPEGIWATFEHVDDTPPIGSGAAREPDAKDAGVPYALRPVEGPRTSGRPPPGAEPVSLAHPPAVDPEPTPVARRHPIRAEIMATNRAYWALPGVASSIWANYMLVSVQWPTLPLPVGPDNDGRYFPGLRLDPDTPGEPYQVDDDGVERNLVNVTMETYEQDAPSSCMACHDAVSNARGRDFVGVLPESGN